LSQKSLPALNKVNVSMIWYITYYYKHYKWLSAQYIYLLYFLNKLFVYLDFLFYKITWVNFVHNDFYMCLKPKLYIDCGKKRFFYPVTAYFVSLPRVSIFFNLFYKTSLDKFQSLNKKNSLELSPYWKENDLINIKLMFYK
jgi:hypothetical protein